MLEAPRRPVRELLAPGGQLDADVIGARCEGTLVDLHSSLPEGSQVTPVRLGEPEALQILRHSAAHVMADAVQRLYPGTQVTIGPAIDSGFYYDFDRKDGAFTERDLQRIEKEMRALIKRNLPFFKQEVSRQEARELFESLGETYKLEILDSIPEGERISLYRHGSPDKPEGQWVDLCEGPHVPSTKYLGAVRLLSVAGAYWRGDEKRQMLQRIYGTAFPTEAELEAHLQRLKEAKERDHRKLGKELELFMFHEWAPAMPFFLPRGAGVYNRLQSFIRELYVDYGYDEVITPQVFDKKLFSTSGHLAHYRENIYMPVTAEELDAVTQALAEGKSEAEQRQRAEELGLGQLVQKPMNCPSHCLIFGQRRRSYRELPWRMADFGRLHRYERGGVVHGLARVRSFCQDDAHVFCTPEQVMQEARAFNDLLFEVYEAFGFTQLAVKLALRPEERMGSDETWDQAEQALATVLTEAKLDFERLPGEGAFYGPKVEYHVTDAIGRSWQLGTVQLDYQMPERFDLEYIGADGNSHRPVMIHRAILGSIERFFGVYVEHVAGKFPVWLAPEQARLVTVSEEQADYAHAVAAQLKAAGLRVTVDDGRDKLGAKIRNARLMRVPYLAVIGKDEAAAGTVAPRTGDGGDLPVMPVRQFTERLVAESRPPRRQGTITSHH